MKPKNFTFIIMCGGLLLFSASGWAQSTSPAAPAKTKQEIKAAQVEASKVAYHKKVMDRKKALEDAKAAKIAAKEAKFQEEEALEDIKDAERQAKAEARNQRLKAKRNGD